MLRTLDKRQKNAEVVPPSSAPLKVEKKNAEVVPSNAAPPAPLKVEKPRKPVPEKVERKEVRKKEAEPRKKPPSSEVFGRIVWITDPVEGFRTARISDISQSGFTLTTLDTNSTVTRGYDETFACEEDPEKSVEDNCALMHLNEATLLNNCRLRYRARKIYSYVANILISINPYQTIDGFYSSQKIREYRGKSLGQKEPHIYAIADKSYREMRRNRQSQSIIVSGESGAGKTESQKAVLRYLCESWGTEAGPIQKRLLETNPILEAFGNAKTLRNNNSSRFGKFVEIHFAENGMVAGGFVSHYLLETSRICHQNSEERNYHIFYQLIAGSSPQLFDYLGLGQPGNFNYLKYGSKSLFTHPDSKSPGKIEKSRCSSKFLHDSMVDDFLDFQRLENALKLTGLDAKSVLFIWTTIAGILHLGNVEFEEIQDDSKGGCRVSTRSEKALMEAGRLLGLDALDMKLGLCARIMQTKGGFKGSLIRVPLKPQEASAGRDALAKAIYSKLFDWLVTQINQSIPFEQSSHYIGVLDVAGFEFYAVNSFEQFCINFCNEKLQHFFNQRILTQEQELYEKEGLNLRKIEFTDNRDCIELFENKNLGLFDLLDEEAKLPTPTFQHFTQRCHEMNRKHFRLDKPRKSKLKSHREMRDDEGFLIRHYAGSVCYETKLFLDKNNDQLHNSLQIMIEQSSSPLLVSLFSTDASKNSTLSSRRLKTQTVGAKFKSQLSDLLEKLESTGTHFVRCIKPNNQMAAWTFDGSAILGQLQCAGMTSVLRLMQDGFPSRTSFRDLYSSYRKRLPPNLARLEPRMFSKCLFRALGLDQHDFQFGPTKVFFRSGKFAEFDQMMKMDAESMTSLISKVNEWLLRGRWRQAQFAVWSVIKLKNKIAYRRAQTIQLQSLCRGFLARQQFSRQISLYRKSSVLLRNSKEIEKILNRLNEKSREKWSSSAHSTIRDLEKLVFHVKLIKGAEQADRAEKAYENYVKRVDSMISEMKKQMRSDELEEVERKRKEEEERKRKEEEEKRRIEKEKNDRRRLAEEQEKAQKAFEAAQLRDQIRIEAEKAEEAKKAESLKKEKLDGMVSQRLANSDGVQLAAESKVVDFPKHDGKYDLSDWSYADLRDTINHSMEMDLLVACKDEFNRRLRVYNEWKALNADKREHESLTAPSSVYESFGVAWTTTPANNKQRYFKVPLEPGNSAAGMWYAHFDGRYIKRQMTLHLNHRPKLLVAGRDDLQMLEKPLDETGLERRQGAEILATEFEEVWRNSGGI